MISKIQSKKEKLYEEDYVCWLDETVEQLRNKDSENLDWEHLIEEIEGLGNEQRRKVDSYLKQLLIHLLLYQYWLSEKERCAKGWEDEIANFRDELEDLFKSKKLYNYCLEQIEQIYQKVKRRAIQKTGLTPNNFPDQCPYTIEQILDFYFLPKDES